MAVPLHKSHIPGFGNWDVANNSVVITEYFDIARAGRGKREGNGNGHVESRSKRGSGIPKSSNIVDGNADIRTGKKIMFAQGGGNNTIRQTEAIPSKPPKSFPGASGEMRASNSGQVLMHQAAVNPPTASQKAQHRVAAEIRPFAPLGPKETEVYQLKSGIKKENYRRGLRSRTESGPSAWTQKEPGGNRTTSPSLRPSNVRKEFGGSRTPSPSTRPSNVRKEFGGNRTRSPPARPSNVRKEFGGNRTPSPPARPSNVQKEFGGRKTPTQSSTRLSKEKQSSNKNHKKKALPRFGDWDSTDPLAGIAFTSIFNDARNEKKAVSAHKTPSQMDAATPIDEDLYKQPSSSHKKHREKLFSILSKIFSGKMICQ